MSHDERDLTAESIESHLRAAAQAAAPEQDEAARHRVTFVPNTASDWKCACGWFGNGSWKGYAAHLHAALASPPPVPAPEQTRREALKELSRDADELGIYIEQDEAVRLRSVIAWAVGWIEDTRTIPGQEVEEREGVNDASMWLTAHKAARWNGRHQPVCRDKRKLPDAASPPPVPTFVPEGWPIRSFDPPPVPAALDAPDGGILAAILEDTPPDILRSALGDSGEGLAAWIVGHWPEYARLSSDQSPPQT